MNQATRPEAKSIIHSIFGMILVLCVLFLIPTVALADALFDGGSLGTGEGSLTNFMANVLNFINIAVIPFLIGVGFLVFVWGMFQFFIYGGANDESKSKGKSLMIYAVVGFVSIIIFWGVVNLIAGSTGLSDQGDVNALDALSPKVNLVK